MQGSYLLNGVIFTFHILAHRFCIVKFSFQIKIKKLHERIFGYKNLFIYLNFLESQRKLTVLIVWVAVNLNILELVFLVQIRLE